MKEDTNDNKESNNILNNATKSIYYSVGLQVFNLLLIFLYLDSFSIDYIFIAWIYI